MSSWIGVSTTAATEQQAARSAAYAIHCFAAIVQLLAIRSRETVLIFLSAWVYDYLIRFGFGAPRERSEREKHTQTATQILHFHTIAKVRRQTFCLFEFFQILISVTENRAT